MKNKILYQVDSFTNTPFKGNPAGVMILDMETSSDWMQQIATEMNLSETAFITPNGDNFNIRFFTPTKEVPLCGHATLASGHIIYELGLRKQNETIRLQAQEDLLTLHKDGDCITMTFPKYPLKKIDIPNRFQEIVGFTPVEIYESKYKWVLALAENENIIKSLQPNIEPMKANELGHLMVTAKSDQNNIDFVVRCFVPWMGIDEDPVTGSAQCALVPYWHMKTGKNEFNSLQVSKRTGELMVALKENSVIIQGKAITVFKIECLF